VPTLIYCDVDGLEHVYELGHTPVVIGRGADCGIRSDDPRMSRQHARVTWTVEGVWIEDLGSANGVYVGLERVSQAPVPPGEIVVVGSIVFQVAVTGTTLPPPVGVHATLAQWLSLERKARRVVEDERNAFAARVGAIHQQQVDAAAQADALLARARGEAGEAGAARAVAEDAMVSTRRELAALRAEHEAALAQHGQQVEGLRLELAAASDARALAVASAGLAEAAARAEADQRIAALEERLAAMLERERLAESVLAAAASAHERALAEMVERVEAAERERTDARVRLQAAERALAEAQAAAARPRTEPPLGTLPREDTSSGTAAFKTIRMSVMTEEPSAEVAAAQATAAAATRRAEAAETTAAAMSRDVTEAMRKVAELEAQLDRRGRELDAAVLRAVAAEQRAESQARAAHDELVAAQRRSGPLPVAPDGRLPTLVMAPQDDREPTAMVRVDAVPSGGELAEAQREIRDLEQQVRELQAALRGQYAGGAGGGDTPATGAPVAPLPDETTWQLDVLEESIDSLRSNLRAAGDELMALTAGASTADAQVAADAVAAADHELRRARGALAELLGALRR
jgi:pSer/pThr/pTyr-binding forkhead associated (FHA) protein